MTTPNYAYVDMAMRNGMVTVWLRDEHGQLFTRQHEESQYSYCYQPSSEKDMINLHNQAMKKVMFNTRREMIDFVGNRNDIAMSDVSVVDKVMIDEYSSIQADAPYNVLYYDIEVAFDLTDGKGYPTPENPHGEINLFQTYDKSKGEYTIITFDDDVMVVDKEDGLPVNLIRVSGEAALLDEVAKLLEDIDVFGGWYTDGFDLPYIMNRALMIFDKEKALTMFCRDGFKARSRTFHNESGKEVTEWQTVGRTHVDMLTLFKKFNPGERTSFSLNAVCEELLGLKKEEFDGDLGTLSRENPQLFHDYGLRDVFLLKRLDEKTDTIALAVMIARLSSIRVNEVTGSIRVIDMGIIKFARDMGIVLPDKVDREKESFEGAIVYDTISGLHEWMMTVDLTALYPSVIRMLGMSPETIVGQLQGGKNDFLDVVERTDKNVRFVVEDGGDIAELKASELWDIIVDSGYTISANGTVFNGKMGVLARYVEMLGSERKKFQKMMRANEDGRGSTWDLFQKVFKVYGNSAYGCVSNQYFRLYDIRLARSITLTAQQVSTFQAVAANNILLETENEIRSGQVA